MKAFRTFMAIVVLVSAVLVSLGAAASPAPVPATLTDVRGLAATTAPSGQAWAVWAADDGWDSELFYSRWDGKAWASPQPVYASPETWESVPSLAFAADGTAWLAWASANQQSSTILVSRWSGYRWSEPEALPLGTVDDADEPALAAAPDGSLWLAWVGSGDTGDEIYASRRTATGWSAPWQVSLDDGDPALYDRQPQLAVGPEGTTWLVWTGHQAGVDDEIYASHWTGEGWTPEQMISINDDALDVSPSLALDAGGQPWVAWKAQVEDGEFSRLRILVSRWDADLGVWTAEAVASSPLAVEVHESDPVLSRGDKDEMRLAWAVRGDAGPALAHSRWAAGQWAEPRLAADGVQTDFMALLPEDNEDGEPALLWLDVTLGARLPVVWLSIKDAAQPLQDWLDEQEAPAYSPNVEPITNRFLAFGDSITWGEYPVDHPTQPPFYPYPSTLSDMLNTRVMEADMVNRGIAGETIHDGMDRIKDELIQYTPQYVMIMEGTNDVSHNRPPADVLNDLLIMLDNAKKHADIDHIKVMLATIIPRLDDKNDETAEMNEQAIAAGASMKNVPLCDPWQVFTDYGPLAPIYWDEKHPNQTGLDMLAGVFYDCLLNFYWWLEEEAMPPETWIDQLNENSECGVVNVSWTGTDNLSWVVDYDVQVNINGGPFADWLIGTQLTSATYLNDDLNFGDQVGFQVRGRDVVGNESSYSTPAYTTITDSDPPEAHAEPLLPTLLAPFSVHWWGTDACADVVAYKAEYQIDGGGTWVQWVTPTPNTSAIFDIPSPQYGHTYCFRASAQDAALNWSLPSNQVCTKLARYGLWGHVFNNRHQPISGAQISVDPTPMQIVPLAGGAFLAYLDSGGPHDLLTARNDLYGPLPWMYDQPVAGDIHGLTFVLPPLDNLVTDGGFESGNLNAWNPGGSLTPLPSAVAHTGLVAARLGSPDDDSHLSQVLTPALPLEAPTLSFMVHLAAPGDPSQLQVELSNGTTLSPPLTFTLNVADEAWTHAWFDLPDLAAEPLTLTLIVSGSPAILLDEVSLGSTHRAGYTIHLPLAQRNW